APDFRRKRFLPAPAGGARTPLAARTTGLRAAPTISPAAIVAQRRRAGVAPARQGAAAGRAAAAAGGQAVGLYPAGRWRRRARHSRGYTTTKLSRCISSGSVMLPRMRAICDDGWRRMRRVSADE